MFAYRHAFHAGNHADVLKHLVLVQLLHYFNQKEKPYWMIDTHAGAGLYRLDQGYATQNAEFAEGISRLWSRNNAPAPIIAYLEQVRALNPPADNTLCFYPGSPMIAQRLLRAQDKLWLFELHPSDSALLSENCSTLKNVKIFSEDGFSGLKALLPPAPRRACVLIDPPYEDKADYQHVIHSVNDALTRFPSGTLMVWYPLLQRPEPREMARKLRGLPNKNWLHITLQVRAPASDGFGMLGSGIFMINPPYTLHDTLQAVLPVLVQVLGQDDAATFSLQQKTL